MNEKDCQKHRQQSYWTIFNYISILDESSVNFTGAISLLPVAYNRSNPHLDTWHTSLPSGIWHFDEFVSSRESLVNEFRTRTTEFLKLWATSSVRTNRDWNRFTLSGPRTILLLHRLPKRVSWCALYDLVFNNTRLIATFCMKNLPQIKEHI